MNVDSSNSAAVASLRALVMSLLSTLVVQFILGMYANLDVSFASGAQSSSPPMAQSMGGMQTVVDHPALMIHMVLGFVIAILAIAALVVALKTGIPGAVWLGAIGLAAVAAAGIGGMTFVMAGQSNASSYVMAIGFLVSFSCYFAELTVARR